MSNISTLLPINQINFKSQLKNTCSGRDLYAFLEVKTKFTMWIKRMFQYGFEETEDYILVSQKWETNNSKNPTTTVIDYQLSIPCAKEISMLQRTEKGKEARKYFIKCEQAAKEMYDLVANDPIMSMRMAQMKLDHRLTAQEKQLKKVEAKITTKNVEHYTISGYASLKGISVGKIQAQLLGKQASKISRAKNILIDKEYDAKYGQINSYHISVLDEIFTSFLSNLQKLKDDAGKN